MAASETQCRTKKPKEFARKKITTGETKFAGSLSVAADLD